MIQKINNGEGQEWFYSCYPEVCDFPHDQWTEISVSAVVTNNDNNDIVKIYLWNPKEMRMMVDDITVEYCEDR